MRPEPHCLSPLPHDLLEPLLLLSSVPATLPSWLILRHAQLPPCRGHWPCPIFKLLFLGVSSGWSPPSQVSVSYPPTEHPTQRRSMHSPHCGLNCDPLEEDLYIEALTPSTCDVTLFGSRVFADMMKVR